jgi:hypothetical protein
MRGRDTPLPTREIENGNTGARGNLGDIPSVHVCSLRLGTPTRETDAVLDFNPGNGASSAAPGDDITAGS